MSVNSHFPEFPKIRPELPQVYRDIYEKEYTENRDGSRFFSNLAQRLEAWMHRQIVLQSKSGSSSHVLEVGAGTLNHVQYENRHQQYDFIEPMEFLYSNREELNSVHIAYASIDDIPEGESYDRILSVAVLEHVVNLPDLVAKSCLFLKPGGVLQAGIPSEGGVMWGLAWRCTTGLSYKLRHKLDYGVLMKHEHVNDAPEIIRVLRFFYENVSVRWFGLPFLHGSLYAYVHATDPRIEIAREFLGTES